MSDLIRRIVEQAFIDGYESATGGERPADALVADVVEDHMVSLESDLPAIPEGAIPVEVTWDSARATYLVEPVGHVPLGTAPGPYYLVKRNPSDGGTP